MGVPRKTGQRDRFSIFDIQGAHPFGARIDLRPIDRFRFGLLLKAQPPNIERGEGGGQEWSQRLTVRSWSPNVSSARTATTLAY